MSSIVDVFSAEDRVQIKISDFYQIMKDGIKAEFLMNAVKCEVPYNHILQMATGITGELQAYKETGLSPEKIRDIDTEYQRICKELTDLRTSNKELTITIEQYQNADIVDATATVASEVTNDTQGTIEDAEEKSEDTEEGGDTQSGRKKIDIGKIMALKNAGWKIKDIADEMHMEPSAVSNAIWRYNKQNENS